MFVANLALEYDGKAWYCHWETDSSAHALGVSPARAVRVVVGPTDGPYSVDTANDMREGLYDLADLLVSHLTDDLIDGAHDEALGMFHTLPPGPLAS